MVHELKCDREYFEAVWSGRKRFEVRHDDRGYQEGDELVLRAHPPEPAGRSVRARVGFVLRDRDTVQIVGGYAHPKFKAFVLYPDAVVMQLENVRRSPPERVGLIDRLFVRVVGRLLGLVG